jgi:biopolymer transport protein ExbD
MNFRRRWKEDPEINLIPFIDVLLVILIFLMVTTTYSKYAELQINLPTADAAPPPSDRPNEIGVAVNAAGQYVINNNAVSFTNVDALTDAMRRAGEGLDDPVVVINADAKATHQAVIQVMQAANQAGYTHITFAAQTSSGK